MQRNHHNQYSRKDYLLHFFPLHPFHAFQWPYCQSALNFMRHLIEQMQNRNLITVVWRKILPWPPTVEILNWLGTVQSFMYPFPFLKILITIIIIVHIQILVNHIYLECSNSSCFSSSISLHMQSQAFLLPHNKDVSYK